MAALVLSASSAVLISATGAPGHSTVEPESPVAASLDWPAPAVPAVEPVIEPAAKVSPTTVASAAVGSVTSSAPSPPEPPLLGPGEYSRALQVGNRQRTYTVVVPAHREGVAPALTVLLHGVGATGPAFRAGAGFDAPAASAGVISVYPDGVDGSWNDGRGNVDSTAHREPVDDVAFLVALVTQTLADTGADPARVTVAGYSNGAMMASRLACERSDLVRSVVVVGATAGVEFPTACHPARPVAVIVLAGTADTVVPIGGGNVAAQVGRPRGAVVALEQYLSAWRGWNGCATWGVAMGGLTWAGVEHRAGAGCRSPVESYLVAGGGHEWFDRPTGPRAADLVAQVSAAS